MKSFKEYLLMESIFTNREGEYGYVGKSKIIDGEQFQLKNLIKKKLNEVVFSKGKTPKHFIDKGTGEYFLKVSSTKEEKKPSVASTIDLFILVH